jgi:hypothetical protein
MNIAMQRISECHASISFRKTKARQWYDRAAEALKKDQVTEEEPRRFRAEAASLLGLPDPALKGNNQGP